MASKIVNYFKESLEEFGKVTWPTKNQAVILSVIVLVVCGILAGFLAVLDYGYGIGISELIKLAQ